jgi:hypothetical protein
MNVRCLDFSCMCCDILHWMTWKATLTGICLEGSLHWTIPSTGSIQHQSFWPLIISVFFLSYIYIPCYISSDGKVIESVMGNQDRILKCHVKWTCLPKSLLCRLGKILVRYIGLLSRKLQYPGAAIYRKLNCIKMQHSSKIGRG